MEDTAHHPEQKVDSNAGALAHTTAAFLHAARAPFYAGLILAITNISVLLASMFLATALPKTTSLYTCMCIGLLGIALVLLFGLVWLKFRIDFDAKVFTAFSAGKVSPHDFDHVLPQLLSKSTQPKPTEDMLEARTMTSRSQGAYVLVKRLWLVCAALAVLLLVTSYLLISF